MALPRIPAALRVLARRRAYLAAMAAAGLLLTLVLVLLLAVAGAVAWAGAALVPAWPVGQVAVAGAFLAFLPFFALALSMLASGVRAYTAFAAGPPPTAPGAVAGALGGLGFFLLGRRLRARRGLLGWLTDPVGSATRMVIQRSLPPDHPFVALLQAAGLEPRKRPTRGAGRMALGIVLTGVAVWLMALQASPALGSLVLALLVPLVPLAGVLGAGVRGALGGAWDRYLVDQMSAQAARAAGAMAGGPGGPGSPRGPVA